MSTLSKVLLGFVIVAALCFIYTAARTLKTHEVWRQAAKDHDRKLAETLANTEKIRLGDPAAEAPEQKKSLPAVKSELYGAITGRGRVWRDCTPGPINPATGELTLTVPIPLKDTGIKVNDLLYAFVGTDMATGRYLGEFKVVQVVEQRVLLQPSLKPGVPELQELALARGQWTLYEVMPADGADVFAGVPVDQLQQFMPKPPRQVPGETEEQLQARRLAYNAVVQEFDRDGKPATDEDPPERVRIQLKFVKNLNELTPQAKAAVDALKLPAIDDPAGEKGPDGVLKKLSPEEYLKAGSLAWFDVPTAQVFVAHEIAQEVERRYQRRWRDYALYFREMNRLLPILQDRVAAETKNNQYMTAAVNDAKTHVTFNNDEIAVLKIELERLKEEAAAVSTNLQSLTEKLQTAQAEIQKLRATNVQLARELGERQRANLQRSGQTAARIPATAAN